MKCPIPAKCIKVLWDPLRRHYKILYGGRGGAKSWSVARYLLLRGAKEKLRILCTREIQNSIKDSVYRLLVDQIYALGLQAFFIIKADTISGVNGTEFLFKGLQKSISEIKSTEGVDICWVEEADKVSENSWVVLIPTIRKDGSEIIITFNPEDEHSATFTRFVEKDGKPVENPEFCREFINYWDVADIFPETLRKEMEWDKKNDDEKYQHVWCGKPKKYGNAVIFRKKIRIEEFETPEGIQLFFGGDFGYAEDAFAAVRMFIQDWTLYIDHEVYGTGIELNELHRLLNTLPGAHKWKIVGDSARPDTISFLCQPFTKDGVEYEGFDVQGAIKGKGSVEDGIEFLKGFKAIVIHPRCKGAIDNFNNYRWRTDRITGEILPIPVDKNNHVPDACRYALEDWQRGGATIYDALQ